MLCLGGEFLAQAIGQLVISRLTAGRFSSPLCHVPGRVGSSPLMRTLTRSRRRVALSLFPSGGMSIPLREQMSRLFMRIGRRRHNRCTGTALRCIINRRMSPMRISRRCRMLWSGWCIMAGRRRGPMGWRGCGRLWYGGRLWDHRRYGLLMRGPIATGCGLIDDLFLSRMPAKPSDISSANVVDGTNNPYLVLDNQLPHLSTGFQQFLNGIPDILPDGRGDQCIAGEVRVLLLCGSDRRLNAIEQLLNISLNMGMLRRSGHRAAPGVPQHHQQRCMQVPHAIFDAPGLIGADDIAGHSNHKQVADPLVKQQFWRNA